MSEYYDRLQYSNCDSISHGIFTLVVEIHCHRLASLHYIPFPNIPFIYYLACTNISNLYARKKRAITLFDSTGKKIYFLDKLFSSRILFFL